MLEFRRREQKSLGIQILQYKRIRILHKDPGVSRFLRHLSLSIYQLYEGQVIPASHLGVVLTKCRGDMNDSGTIRHGNIGITDNVICLFVLLLTNLHRAVKQGLIFSALQIGSLISLQNLIRTALFRQTTQHGVQKLFCHIISIPVCCLYFAVSLLRVYTEGDIAGQRPGCGGPCQEIRILTHYFKTGNGGALLHCLVALGYLMGGQRRTASRAVGHDLKPFVQQLFIPDLLQCPPL